MRSKRSRMSHPSAKLPLWRASAVLLALSLTGPPTLLAQRGASPHPLTALQSGSGWVSIGILRVESQTLATVSKWEVVKRRSGRPGPFPGPHDVLRVTHEMGVVMLDYRSQGEANWMVSPADRMLGPADTTGVMLPPGTEVVVLEISPDTPTAEGAQPFWARVGIP